MSLVTAAQKMCATRKYIAAAKIFTVVSALLVVREYARAAQSDRRVRVDSQTFTNQVTDSRRFDLSTWARELLRDVGPKANSDGIRVGLRYMQAEDKPFWMTVPYKIPLGELLVFMPMNGLKSQYSRFVMLSVAMEMAS
ncbi:predicted protein [Ostreococcus lucimarinus CCE9901]|uniref:Uncharacterized protein n=1 Tax=Ostreococcus lucimarinus (strain CCE9901) TaxID=436017 RepID=A4SAB6_OSTLU|nr:predicted protein [Ostreococcus lucimarinus CCE9901]ABP00674.1 predicted protein [Ostreococcus lucimarinus CCE9901]|eukprot:XP_001422357.1 predicted protein [Ostreococcus lucimarinus CCE9901]